MRLIPYLITVPLASAFIILLVGKRARGSSAALAVAASVLLSVLSCLVASSVSAHKVLVCRVGGFMPPLGISMVVDALSAFILVVVNIVALLVVVFLIVSLVRLQPFSPKADTASAIGIIVAAGLTFVMYSFLYRDNPLFKIAENLYVGVTLGYGAIMTWRLSLMPEVYDPFFNSPTWGAFWNSALHRTVPIILGVLLVTRLSRKYGWLSRYSYALMIGWGSGLAIPLTVHSYILQQLSSAIAPFHETVAHAAAVPIFSPKSRLRLQPPWQVATRSPKPLSP